MRHMRLFILTDLKPLFQSEAKCRAIDMTMSFYSLANKTHFHNKGLAHGLALKVRGFGTRKWPIESCWRKFDIEQTFRCWTIFFLQLEETMLNLVAITRPPYNPTGKFTSIQKRNSKCIGISKRTFKYYLEQHHLEWECSLPKLNGSFFEDDQQEAHKSSGNDENVHEEVEWENLVTNSCDPRLSISDSATITGECIKNCKIGQDWSRNVGCFSAYCVWHMALKGRSLFKGKRGLIMRIMWPENRVYVC